MILFYLLNNIEIWVKSLDVLIISSHPSRSRIISFLSSHLSIKNSNFVYVMEECHRLPSRVYSLFDHHFNINSHLSITIISFLLIINHLISHLTIYHLINLIIPSTIINHLPSSHLWSHHLPSHHTSFSGWWVYNSMHSWFPL